MPPDEPADPAAEIHALAAALDAAAPRTPAEHVELAELTARLARLVEVLVGRGVLSERDRMLLERLGQAARKPRVQLAVVTDKRAVDSPPIDCASLLHLCHGRCCSFWVPLSPDDVREGKLRWQLEDPYLLERGDDGYCVHLRGEAAGGGCECYDDRPATCRVYDCRDDRRVWFDFERRIPAPMPDRVKPRFGR